jgi:hypothetical protein
MPQGLKSRGVVAPSNADSTPWRNAQRNCGGFSPSSATLTPAETPPPISIASATKRGSTFSGPSTMWAASSWMASLTRR